jgi:FtsH-binding integral membrane protein
MFDILFARTFVIVWVMLLITAWASYLNKNANINKMWWGSIIMSFGLLFAIMIFDDVFPLNLILVWLFSAAIGWMISPTIKGIWNNFKVKKFIKDRGIVLKKGEKLSSQQSQDFGNYLEENRWAEEWNKIVSQAMMSTALAVFATASLVFISDIDFSFMWIFLFL